MDNRTIADRLLELAHSLEDQHASFYRVQAYRRQQEERRRKHIEIDGLGNVHRNHQDDYRHHDVGHDQQVEQKARHGRDGC